MTARRLLFCLLSGYQPTDRRCQTDLPSSGTAPQGGLGSLCAPRATRIQSGLVQKRRPCARSGDLQGRPPSADNDLVVLPETWLTNVPSYLPGIPK